MVKQNSGKISPKKIRNFPKSILTYNLMRNIQNDE